MELSYSFNLKIDQIKFSLDLLINTLEWSDYFPQELILIPGKKLKIFWLYWNDLIMKKVEFKNR